MERILVPISEKQEAWEAFSRACSLVRRIDAKLYVLLVLTPSDKRNSRSELEQSKTVRTRLELLLETAKAEGVKIEYFITEGSYEEEVIGFVRENRISLLVLEQNDGEIGPDPAALMALRHRIACRVELVAPKKNTLNPEERNS